MTSRFVLALLLALPLSGADPALSGDLVFAADPDSNWDLFLVRFPDLRVERLTETPEDERLPTLSPDRGSVAYSLPDGRLGVLEINSREMKRIGESGERLGAPAWLDDFTLVATRYQTLPEGEQASLLSVDIATGGRTVLLEELVAVDSAAPSPSGDRLAYLVYMQTRVGGSGFRATQDLAVTTLAGALTLRLSPGGSIVGRPAWAPDGARLALAAGRGDHPPALLVADLDSQSLAELAPGPVQSAAWSPDGGSIIFVRPHEGRTQLFVLELASGRTSILVLQAPELAGMNHSDPTWR